MGQKATNVGGLVPVFQRVAPVLHQSAELSQRLGSRGAGRQAQGHCLSHPGTADRENEHDSDDPIATGRPRKRAAPSRTQIAALQRLETVGSCPAFYPPGRVGEKANMRCDSRTRVISIPSRVPGIASTKPTSNSPGSPTASGRYRNAGGTARDREFH